MHAITGRRAFAAGIAVLVALAIPNRAGAEPKGEVAGWSVRGSTGGSLSRRSTGATPALRSGGPSLAGPSDSSSLVEGASVGAAATLSPAPSLPVAPPAVHTAVVAGGVLPFGGAPNYGSLAGRELSKPVVAMAATPDGRGYWLVASDGGIFTFGDAHFYGSTGNIRLNQPIVAMAATPDGHGYWLVASDGGIFTFGDAHFYGSTGNIRLNQPIVAMAATPDGHGYWLVASDGGIFTFGDAHFYGSTGNIRLNQPIVAMAPTPDGHGYWLAASDGGIFTFGDAHFYGSTGNIRLNQPIVAMAPTPDGHGYWLAASDGGIFTFGDAHFYGSAANRSLAEPIAGIVRDEHGNGYWLYEGRRAGVAADPFTPALVSALNERSGVITAFVLDLDTGDAYDYRPGQQDITASIVKVEILGTLLREVQAQGRGLNQTEQSLAVSMIEDSDDDSATDLWNEEGGAPAVAGFDASVGMASTTVSYAWGLTVTTAADQVALLEHLVESNPVLTAASRAYELGLMEHVTPSQAWGVSAGVPPGVTVALKNGWLPVGADWEVNSIGWVDGGGHNYLIAVLSSGDPSESYGIDSISLVAEAAWAALGGS